MPETIYEATSKFIDALKSLPGKLLPNIVIIAIVTGIGLTLITARYVFMEFCPWGADHSKITTAFVNILIETIWFVFSMIEVSVEVIIDAIRILEGKKARFHIPKPPKPLNSHQVEAFLQEIPIRCHKYTELKYLFDWPMRQLLSPSVCPLLRFVWPIPWLYDLLYALIGWLSFDPTPIAGGNNCQQENTKEWVCIALGSGYLIVEVLVPILLFVLVGAHFIAVAITQATFFVNLIIQRVKTFFLHFRL